MRIGYLTSQYPATSHTFIRREVVALRERGLDVETFSILKPGVDERAAPSEREAMDGTWYVLPPRADLLGAHLRGLLLHPLRYARALSESLGHRVPGARALLYSLLYFGEAVYLAERLRSARIEHLHNHFANSAAIVGFLASNYLGIPWSLTLHGISEFDYPSGQLLTPKLERAAFVACVADFTRAQAMRTVSSEHWHKLFINRCGVDLAAIQARGAKAAGTGGERLRILCVARLSPEKALPGLLEAFAAVIEGGVDAELRIIGDGPEADALAGDVASRGLGDRVSLPGRMSEDDVIAEVAAADVLAMSSLMEGLPVVLMEALAQGVPVVAPGVAGIPELVEHEATGLLFPPSNWALLARALLRLSRDPELRTRLGEAGRQRVAAEFDIHRAVEPIAARFEGDGAEARDAR